ncbi:MAG: efflux RND transporter periplasmic adaptor subunit [Myxococcota bacterium]
MNGSEYVATVRSRDSADIRPQVTGRITQIRVRSGQRVDAGQVLMRIDQSRQRAAVNQAMAATAEANASLQRARADLAGLRAERQAQATDVNYNRKQRDRIRELFAADNASREEFDRATATLGSSEARLQAIDAQIQAQEAAIRGIRSSVQRSSSQVDEGEAELDYYNVAAGIEGTLGDIPVRVGDLVDPSTLLTTIEGATTRELLIQVPVEQLPRLRPGLEVEARSSKNELLDTLIIDFISPSVDPITQTILVKANIPEEDNVVVGQFVRAVVIWDRTTGPAIPATAVLRLNTQPFIFKVKDGQPPTVAQVPVRLGPLQDGRYLVEDGVAVGDKIVLKGIQRLADGRPITPLPAETQSQGSESSPTDKSAEDAEVGGGN